MGIGKNKIAKEICIKKRGEREFQDAPFFVISRVVGSDYWSSESEGFKNVKNALTKMKSVRKAGWLNFVFIIVPNKL
tara:strand:+ start:8649 stop:8879 length:231 start_codon:yes stop_codon:yes gene_type:complete